MTESAHRITQAVLAALEGGDPVAIATMVRVPVESDGAPDGPAVGAKLLVRPDGSRLGSLDGGPLDEVVAAECHVAFSASPRLNVRSLYYTAHGRQVHRLDEEAGAAYQVMIELFEAPARLVVVGGGHIGLSLAEMGAHVGFSVTVVDDRPEFASRERFPWADEVLCGDLVGVLRNLEITSTSYVVVVTRGHRLDELALRQVVTSPAAYVGMIGSKRRTATVLQHLADDGYPIDALERVHTPIGLDIGAETPEEIAVSILAEIIRVRRGGPSPGKGGSMSKRRSAKIKAPRAAGRASGRDG
jgi:xanthine dehydrogenase accessory factor